MAGTPPVNPQTGHPADDSGARGVGGGRVDPPHEMHYMGNWPFGPPNNPDLDSDVFNDTELHVQAPHGGGDEFGDMHPFKLQFFIDTDESSETFGEERLRIYTGMLTAMINSFEYDENSDTRNTYSLSVTSCTGSLCDSSVYIPEQTTDTSGAHDHTGSLTTDTSGAHTHTGTSTEHNNDQTGIATTSEGGHSHSTTNTGTIVGGAGSAGVDHSHTVTLDAEASHSHTLTVPSHSHNVTLPSDGGHTHSVTIPSDGGHTHTVPSQALPPHSHKLSEHVSLDDPVVTQVDKFLTVGSQRAIHGMLQIEPEGFENLTNDLGQELPHRAQTLPDDETYGKVYLTWDLNTASVPPAGKAAVANVIQNVKIHVEPHPDGGDADDPEDTDTGALDVKDNQWVAERGAPKTGQYYLHIGTTYNTAIDPAEDVAIEDINIKKIVQVIYENVYYSPFILPEKT